MPYKNFEVPFVSDDELTEELKIIIKSEIKRRNLRFNNEVFYSRSITECERRLIYRANGERTDEVLPVMEECSQEAIKNKWISFFSDAKRVTLIAKDLDVVDNNFNLVGKVDGVLRIGNLFTILMVKGLPSNEYADVLQNGAKRKHLVEIIINMWLAEIHHGVLLYENKDNNNFHILHVEPYEAIIGAVSRKCTKMIDFKFNSKLPPRPYKNNNSKECIECGYRTACWQ